MMLKVKLARLIASFFSALNLKQVFLVFIGYVSITALLLSISGESELLDPEVFFYWIVVTGSTVGYGDFSPVTAAGKWVTALWVIPVGLSVFALALTRLGVLFGNFFMSQKKGLSLIDLENHTVIIGWNGQKTIQLINLLLDKSEKTSSEIVLVASKVDENPMPGIIDFVKAETFTNDADMMRSKLVEAERIIIDTESDEVTITTALYCFAKAPDTHTIAHIRDPNTAKILQQHCTNIELVPDVSVEMIAKAANDKGSSKLQKELLDASNGETQYSSVLDADFTPIKYFDVMTALKLRGSATLIGIKKKNSSRITLNASQNALVEPGDTLYYIADNRINISQKALFNYVK